MIGPEPTDDTMESVERYLTQLLDTIRRARLAHMRESDDSAASVSTATAPHSDGLGRKYHVVRLDGTDGTGGKHHGCDLFVLDLTHDPAARAALIAYCAAAYRARPALVADLTARYLA